MKILVTGYKGFIGSKIYREFIEESEFFEEPHDKEFVVDGLEINDPFPTKKYDRIYHFGGKTLLRESGKDPFDYFEQNVNFTAKLLEKARKDDSAFIFPTSGSAGKTNNPYSVSKYMAEKWVKMYGEFYGLKGIIFRLYNVYGGQKGAIYNFLKAAYLNKAITVHNYGANIRDYIHIYDIISEITSRTPQETIYEVEVGTGKATSTTELIKTIEEITEHQFEIIYETSPVEEAIYSVSPVKKTIYIPLKKGIEIVIDEVIMREMKQNWEMKKNE